MDKAALFAMVVILSRTFNVIPNNLGLTEIICGYLSAAWGWNLSQGIIISGLLRVIDYLVGTALGILFAKTIFPYKSIREQE